MNPFPGFNDQIERASLFLMELEPYLVLAVLISFHEARAYQLLQFGNNGCNVHTAH
jgi:hypothetical protein